MHHDGLLTIEFKPEGYPVTITLLDITSREPVATVSVSPHEFEKAVRGLPQRPVHYETSDHPERIGKARIVRSVNIQCKENIGRASAFLPLETGLSRSGWELLSDGSCVVQDKPGEYIVTLVRYD